MSTLLRGWPAKAVLGCVLGLALPVLSPSVAEAQNRPTACDILTAHPDDPSRVSEPVPWNERGTGRAIPACEEAVRREPNNMRLRFQLGLAQDSAGNHAASIGHYTAAAQGGYVAAGMAVAWALANGEGVPRNDEMAAQWYRWAADRGHSGAANTLGFMFEHGRGVSRDLAQAAEWYRRAYAINARPVAGYNYARLIAAGRDVPRDLPRAVQILRAVTQAGRTDAALHLALMAERNEAPGVSRAETIQLLAFAETATAQQDRPRRSLSRLATQGLGAEVEQAQRAAATRVAAQERQDDERRRARERAYAAAVGASGGMVGSLAPLSAPSASADGATPDTGGGLPANSLVRASITAPDNPTPGATFRIEWRMAANMPDRPHLLRGQALSAAPTGGSQPATFDLNERLSRGARQDLLVISLPESVRVEGSGFAVVPPRANMPFGAQYEMDRLKIVIPLHFSESPISGVLNVRFFSSGESHINIERIMIANDGRVLHTEQAEQFTIELLTKILIS